MLVVKKYKMRKNIKHPFYYFLIFFPLLLSFRLLSFRPIVSCLIKGKKHQRTLQLVKINVCEKMDNKMDSFNVMTVRIDIKGEHFISNTHSSKNPVEIKEMTQ